jgi:hypothetical protein
VDEEKDLKRENHAYAIAIIRIADAWKAGSMGDVSQAISDACCLIDDCPMRCTKDKRDGL